MKPRRASLAQFLATALPLLGGGLPACSPSPSASPGAGTERPPALTVRRGPLSDRFTVSGELEAIHSEKLLVPRTPDGMLKLAWMREDGEQVQAGDKLIEFDTSSSDRAIEEKRSALAQRQNELKQEQALAEQTLAEKGMAVQRQRATLSKAEIEAKVPPDLYPRREYEERRLRYLQAQDGLRKAEEELAGQKRTTELELKVKGLALARAEQELKDLSSRLSALLLRAPRAGLLQIALNRREGRRYLVGDSVYYGNSVASLPDLSSMQIRARLSDVDDGAVRPGMAAECILDAYPERRFRGQVRELSPIARVEGRDSQRRFFEVIVSLEHTETSIMRPGMSVRLEVLRRTLPATLQIPRAALSFRSESGGSTVERGDGRSVVVTIEFCEELSCAIREQPELSPGTELRPAAPSTEGRR